MRTLAFANRKGGVGKKRKEERSGTAYHEAGHAVVAVVLGRRPLERALERSARAQKRRD